MRSVLMACALLCIAACSPKEPRVEKKPPEGRVETRSIRNVDAIGYSGSAIANKLDGALDANDQRPDELNKQIDAQTQP